MRDQIPISISLNPQLEEGDQQPQTNRSKLRLFTISSLAVMIAVIISFISKLLVYLINLITNISFYGIFDVTTRSPAENSLGIFVIIIPVLGGIIVGMMALYGSKGIRGHGIPEAMEHILTNQSKIKPTMTYLKPVSSAISIGTGGPFGSEGPIIATGGALGSTFGQLFSITHNERKILLAAGAAAGMSAIFGSPIAAIFLAIELLLFEFSPRSIIPVSLACITGAAGHHFFFGPERVFAMNEFISPPSNISIAMYSLVGIAMGLLSIGATRIVYFVEDSFEKLPIHWMIWPAIGGIAVGAIGYFFPRTLGVGYNNITDLLSGQLTMHVIFTLCIFKFISWAISLGSGTSGGTLAPLLTIGGAAGSLLGIAILKIFPSSGVSIPLAALTGMAAMFAGASRAFLTSIIFALETTGQANALLSLLAAGGASYFVSFFFMENTIMTEKIARRGVKAPDSYEPDILEKIFVKQVMQKNGLIISEENSIKEVIDLLTVEPDYRTNYFIITNSSGEYKGILSSSTLFGKHHNPDTQVGSLVRRRNISVRPNQSLRIAVEMMAHENVDVLPVLSENIVSGILSYHNIISSYRNSIDEHVTRHRQLSIKRGGLKILLHGQKILKMIKR